MLKVYMSELVVDGSYGDRRAYLEQIHSSILKKLAALGIPLTTELEEASFMIIIFTRCFLPRCSKDLLNILKPGVQHCVLFCDWTSLPPTSVTDMYGLLTGYIKNYEALGIPWESMEDLCFNELLKDCDQQRPELLSAFESLFIQSTTTSWALPDGVYLPEASSDPDTIVDEFVRVAAGAVNTLSVDFHKLSGMEPDLLEISKRIVKNADKRATRFLLVSGTKQTQHLTTITKFLAMEQMSSSAFDAVNYHDNCPNEFPPNFAELLIVSLFGLTNSADTHDEYLYLVNQSPDREYKFIIALDGVSTLSQLKEIRKLDAMFTKLFPGTMLLLSSELDIFTKFNHPASDLDFMGYINAPTLNSQNASVVDVVASRPFCIELTGESLERMITVYEDQSAGTNIFNALRPCTRKELEKTSAEHFNDIKESAGNSSRASDEEEEALGGGKKLKIV